MKEKIGKFLRILSVEMSDMEEGIVMLLESTRERHQKKQITEYVKTENSSLLQHELNILKLIHLEIDKLSADQFDSIEAVKTEVRKILNDRGELPKAIQLFLEKRMEKVVQYMKQE
jgi:hypothetical protein